MKVVWSPPIFELPTNPPYYKNVWFMTNTHEVWLEPDRYMSIKHAMESVESNDCKRIAILELTN